MNAAKTSRQDQSLRFVVVFAVLSARSVMKQWDLDISLDLLTLFLTLTLTLILNWYHWQVFLDLSSASQGNVLRKNVVYPEQQGK